MAPLLCAMLALTAGDSNPITTILTPKHGHGVPMIKQVTLAAAFAMTSLTAALAETPEERQACTDDAFRVCQQAIPDRDRVFACLVQNASQLSALCRNALAPYIVAEKPSKQPAQGKTKTTSKKNSRAPVSLSPE
jgi:hypothetical protein